MKPILLSAFLLICSVGAAAQSANVLCRQMAGAARQKDTLAFDRFFQAWHRALQPAAAESYRQNDTVTALYETYDLVFRPYRPDSIFRLFDAESMFGKYDPNRGSRYLLIQPTIDYIILPADSFIRFDIADFNFSHKGTTLTTFRPPLSHDGEKTLYVTEAYEKAINQFLHTGRYHQRRDESYPPWSEESRSRLGLIRHFLPALNGRNYWDLKTDPFVAMAFFNPDFTGARLLIQCESDWGEVVLQKMNGGWKIIFAEYKFTAC